MGKPPSTRVMEIFSEAAASDAADRDALLDRACAGDPELRAEVESLLNVEARAAGFLGAPTVEVSDSPASWEDTHPLDPILADSIVIGRYRIVERIGEGGFGVVYRARQDHPIRREIALKIVKLGMDTRQVIARFESERQALALMDHPNIARIFDAGATPEGRPYFVMELVRGSPITDYGDSHRLSIARRLELFTAVCHAVQHAHQKGIIHRDLKPSNILVADVDGSAVPKVIDFGIAKAIQPGPGEQTAGTELRHFLGTPQYMSPEQAGAGDGGVDTRSDIYSLGVLVYELLTGATPFAGQTVKDASYEQMLRVVRDNDPPKPSTRLHAMNGSLAEVARRRGVDAPRLRRTVAGELDWIVMKALEKDRGRRYETVGALADDVRRYLTQEPVLAGPPDTLYRVRKFTRRHRKSLLVAASLALAMLLGLAGTTYGLIRAKRDRDRAQAAYDTAQAIGSFLGDMLRSANPDLAKGNRLMVRDVIDRASRQIEQGSLRDKPLVEAAVHLTIAGTYSSLGLYNEAEKHYRKSYEIRRRILGIENRETIRSMTSLAWMMVDRADYDSAEALSREALAAQQKIMRPDDPDVLANMTILGVIARRKHQYDRAESLMRGGLEMSRRQPNDDLTAGFLTELGVILLDKHDYRGAEPLFREVIAMDRKHHGDLHRNVARNLGNLAVVLRARGDLKGAEQDWTEAIRIERQILPPDHPDTAWNLRLLGQVKMEEGDLTAAEKYFRESLDMERKIFGNQHPIVADVLEDLSDALRRAHRDSEARAFASEALRIRLVREEAATAAHPNDSSHLSALADLNLRNGEFQKALERLGRAAALDPSNHWNWFELACLRLYLGDDAGYREACRELLDRFAKSDRVEIADRTAKSCLLSPQPVGDLDHLTRLTEHAVASGGPYVAWFHLGKGLAEYRAGHYRSAHESLTRASGVDDTWGTPTVKLLTAMTDLRLGNTAAAQAAYRAVLDELATLPRPTSDDLGSGPENFLVFQVLLREAKSSFGAAVATTQPSR